MTRRHLVFECEGSLLVGTLDDGADQTGLLIVTGGNEVRSGAFAGQAELAARISARGFPVFRFDRRGIGDSEGPNGEFTSSSRDIAAALAEFQAQCPHMTRTIGLGNCDGASALMLNEGAGLDGLLLSNPWTFEESDSASEAPPEAVREHYRRRLADPAAIKRLLTGQVSIGKLVRSLKDAVRPAPPPSGLAQDMARGMRVFTGSAVFLIAENDRTGQAFLSGWDKSDPRIRSCPGASHGYVEPHARQWLAGQVLEMLDMLEAQ